MKRVLFLDRDGTIIREPKDNFQIDSFEKLSFLPDAISSLRQITLFSNFELVMITNQDGLGTESFPEKDFWPAHNLMLEILEGEGIKFSEIIIDRTFEKDNSDTRKPGTALLKKYFSSDYDLEDSYVIGDRITDIELANNLNAQGILISEEAGLELDGVQAKTWKEISSLILSKSRQSKIQRKTKETEILIELFLDGSGKSEISTGLAFFDHMLEQIARHGKFDLNIRVNGDLEVDEHHTVEDTAIALGEAFLDALGEKRGISRYGFLLPMDDSLAQVAIDFSGRSWLVWEAEFKREKVGDLPTEMFSHFFKSFSESSKSNINIKVEGENEHHKIESIFKAFAKTLNQACARDLSEEEVPSSKGVL